MSIKRCLVLTNTETKKKRIVQSVAIFQGKEFLLSALNSKLNSTNQPTNQQTK